MGRPKGIPNRIKQNACAKSVSLPRQIWEQLAVIGEQQKKTPQRIAAEIIIGFIERQK